MTKPLRRLSARAALLLSGSLVPGAALPAFATYFDKQKYDRNIGFDTPMSTIAGLTDWARDINYVYGITTWITVLIFFAVAIPVCLAIWKFRAKPGDENLPPPKQVHGNAMLEFAWTIIPCILLVFIAIPTWRVIFRNSAGAPADALKIDVVGHQWWWEFRYPDLGVTTANELHLPENKAVVFTLWSQDVIHSFWVPNFGGKVDVLPGHKNTMMYTTPPLPAENKVGGKYYQGQCVELCGASHALMRFHAVVHTAEEFNSWAAAAKTPPQVATSQQKKGEQAFAKCVACHTIAGTASEQIPGDKIGPNLTTFGSRAYLGAGTRVNTPENLAAWLADPAKIKPEALMPNLGLSEDEIAALSAYLRQSTAKQF